ncbi:MAG: hypothetical protein ACRCTP_09065 [Aeromonas popoffii]|uniref:hypothetical protein n=1 Tax=Aeromonas popoffii TaxID=70856 RepID=UPI003F372DB5
MAVLGLIGVIIVGIIFGVHHGQENNVTRSTRPKRGVNANQDKCLAKYGGIELEYERGSTTSYNFDLCSVIECGGKNSSWRGYDVYLCGLGVPGNQKWCPTWGHVWVATNVDHQTRIKDFTIQRDFSLSQNPITIAIIKLKEDPYRKKATGVPGQCWGTTVGQFYLLLGVCHMFGDLCCTFITNNTAPDGSVTKALEGLRTLSAEMKEH